MSDEQQQDSQVQTGQASQSAPEPDEEQEMEAAGYRKVRGAYRK